MRRDTVAYLMQLAMMLHACIFKPLSARGEILGKWAIDHISELTKVDVETRNYWAERMAAERGGCFINQFGNANAAEDDHESERGMYGGGGMTLLDLWYTFFHLSVDDCGKGIHSVAAHYPVLGGLLCLHGVDRGHSSRNMRSHSLLLVNCQTSERPYRKPSGGNYPLESTNVFHEIASQLKSRGFGLPHYFVHSAGTGTFVC